MMPTTECQVAVEPSGAPQLMTPLQSVTSSATVLGVRNSVSSLAPSDVTDARIDLENPGTDFNSERSEEEDGGPIEVPPRSEDGIELPFSGGVGPSAIPTGTAEGGGNENDKAFDGVGERHHPSAVNVPAPASDADPAAESCSIDGASSAVADADSCLPHRAVLKGRSGRLLL